MPTFNLRCVRCLLPTEFFGSHLEASNTPCSCGCNTEIVIQAVPYKYGGIEYQNPKYAKNDWKDAKFGFVKGGKDGLDFEEI